MDPKLFNGAHESYQSHSVSPRFFLEGMPRTSFLHFGHAINSETQLAVIRWYASDSILSVRVRDHCNRCNTVASAQKAVVRWRTTDSIRHWQRLEQLDKKLLCATITQQIEIPAWGALNAICALLPILAPADPDTAVSCRRPRYRCTSRPPRCVIQLWESSALQLIGSLFMLFYLARNKCCTTGTMGTSHDNSTIPKRSLAQVETEGRTRPTSVFLDGNGLTDIGVIDSAAATFSTNRSFSPRVRSFENSVGLIKENVAGLPQEPDVLRGMIFALSTTRGRG